MLAESALVINNSAITGNSGTMNSLTVPQQKVDARQRPQIAEVKPQSRNWTWAVPLLLAAAVGASYASGWQGPFVFDDGVKIVENARIRHLWPADWLQNTTRPVVQASFAVNYALHGLHVWGYHLTNIAIHFLTSLVLWALVRRVLLRLHHQGRFHLSPETWAAAVALLWAVHPLTTSSISYIVQRSEAMASLCYLLVLYTMLRGAEASRRSWIWYSLAVVCCWLGAGCKEIIATAPLAALLFDRAFLADSWNQLLRRRWPLYIGLAGCWGILAWLIVSSPQVFETVGFGSQQLSSWDYLRTQSGVILHYLKLSFWPYPQALDYYDWPAARSLSAWLPQGLTLLALLVGSVWLFIKRPAAGFLPILFFIVLAPTSSIMPLADVAFEHRMYLPLAAVLGSSLLALGYLCHWALGKRAMPIVAWMPVALLICLGPVWGTMTYARNTQYASRKTLWEQTVKVRPENARAHDQLGLALTEQGHLMPAMEHARLAVALAPQSAVANNNLAVVLDALGNRLEAIDFFRQALEIKPDYAESHNNLGNALLAQQQLPTAITHYRKAVELQPHVPEYRYHLAGALLRQGDVTQATELYQQALNDTAQGYARDTEALLPRLECNLGSALARLGKFEESEQHFQRSVTANPQSAEAYFHWGQMLNLQNKRAESLEKFRQSWKLDNSRPDTVFEIGNSLVVLGRLEEARDEFEHMLTMKCCHGEGRFRLGLVYFYLNQPLKALENYREALKCNPYLWEAKFELVWLLATHPSPEVRNGEEALSIIEPWCKESEQMIVPAFHSLQGRDALAAAYAELGRFREAVEHAEKAIVQAESFPSTPPEHTSEKIQYRQQLYRRGLPYRLDIPEFTTP